jgi:ADP-heptose:LPS heptosyltransferase
MPNKILVLVGSQSLGDTLCAIPTIKHLNKIYNKNIHVFTYQPELLKNYPYITLSDNYNSEKDDLLIESFRPDKFVHTRTDIRQLHAISSGFQLLPEEMEIEFYPDPYETIENLPENYIVIHPSKTWPSRTWEKERWQELINKININIPIVIIGKNSSESGTYHIQKPVYDINIKNGLNLINKINIHQTWHVINKSSMVITMDSGILHLAGTTDTYIIQLGSSVEPRFRAPYRKGTQNYKYSYILGECNLFCCSNMKYNIGHNGSHTIMPPVAFCLEKPETIGQDIDPDSNLYKCHPTVNQVFEEIIKNYKFSTSGKFLI